MKPGRIDPKPSGAATAWACAGILVAGLAVYSNSFSGPFIFDDFMSIPQNPTLHHWYTAFRPPPGGLTVSGRPILNLSFALNAAISGDRVWSYHGLNVIIHVLAALILFGVIRRTLGSRDGDFIAFGAALLWAVHPLQTESVSYVVQRAESLVALFYLLTLYGFIRGATGNRRWFGFAWLCCLLGMATKEVMVSAPVIVLLYDRTFVAGSFAQAWRQRHKVHVALAATWLPLLALVLATGNRGGTAGFGVKVGFWRYFATQFEALAHYLRLAVWPHPLIIDYGAQWARSVGDVAPYAVLVAALVAGTTLALVRRPALGFLGAVFFAVLAPTSLVPGIRQTLAEHRMYLPLAVVMVLLVAGLRWALGRNARYVVAAAAVGLGGLTLERNGVYRTDEGIWRDTVVHRPGNPWAHNNYGNILAQEGRLTEAVDQYRQALRIDPKYGDAYYNAGRALRKLGNVPAAVGFLAQAVQLAPHDFAARRDFASVLFQAGLMPAAIEQFEEALRLRPDDPGAPEIRNNLGMALCATGRVPEGIAQFRAALRANPHLALARRNLAIALQSVGR